VRAFFFQFHTFRLAASASQLLCKFSEVSTRRWKFEFANLNLTLDREEIRTDSYLFLLSKRFSFFRTIGNAESGLHATFAADGSQLRGESSSLRRIFIRETFPGRSLSRRINRLKQTERRDLKQINIIHIYFEMPLQL